MSVRRLPRKPSTRCQQQVRARFLRVESLEPRTMLAADLVSAADPALLGDTASGESHSTAYAITPDGRYAVFSSDASDLVAGDSNLTFDVFVRDLALGTTVRASTDSGGSEGNGESFYAAISDDGRYVSFQSAATNLVAGDTNGKSDIFRMDLQTGALARVSTDSSGVQANNRSQQSDISSDGRYVAFVSYASNLAAGASNGQGNIFRKDLTTGVTVLVSANDQGTAGNDESAAVPTISGDGRYVAFDSLANNLVSGDSSDSVDVFRKDLDTGAIVLVNSNASGIKADRDADTSAMSSDGRYVAFRSSATNLVAGGFNTQVHIFRKDLSDGSILLVSTDSSGNLGNGDSIFPAISADGRYVAFQTHSTNLFAGDGLNSEDIVRKDLQTGEIVLVNADSGGIQGDSSADRPAMSGDGNFVSFYSEATNLAPNDRNGQSDVFRKNLTTGAVAIVSSRNANVPSFSAAALSSSLAAPSVSDNGRYVVFYSRADNLIPGTTIAYDKVFLRDLQTDTTVLVSTSASGVSATTDARSAIISGNGQYVVFSSDADNLIDGDEPGSIDVFRKNLFTGAIEIVNVTFGGIRANYLIESFAVSDDGRYIALATGADNLVAGDDNSTSDVFRKDMFTGAVVLVSTTAGGVVGNSNSGLPAISGDGRYVSFESSAENLVPGDNNSYSDIFRKDLTTGAVELVSVTAGGLQGDHFTTSPAMSSDGRYVTFATFATNLVAGDNNTHFDVFRKDLADGSLVLVSVRPDGLIGSDGSDSATISDDGRYVAFRSRSENFASDDDNDDYDVFLKDLTSGTVTLLSRTAFISTSSGSGLASHSHSPTLSGNASRVVLVTGGRVVAGDGNLLDDVYAYSTGVLSAVAASTDVGLDGSGNLIITDAGGTSHDELTVQTSGSLVIVSDPNNLLAPGLGMSAIDGNTVSIPLASIAGNIQINTLGGNDHVTLDYFGGNFGRDIVYQGGAGGSDSLQVIGDATDSVQHTFTNANDGSIALAGALTGTITYTGLEPIVDQILNVADRVFTFNGGAETITLTTGANLQNRIDSTLGESVEFNNPTGSLTINAGTGADTITVSSLDSGFEAALTINGDAGSDTVNLNADISFGTGKSLDIDLTNDAAPGDADEISVGTGANLSLAGTGAATLKASRNISLASAASIATVHGSLTLEANQQAIASTGSFSGISLHLATVESTGSGSVTVKGIGGDAGFAKGVVLDRGNIRGGTSGTVLVQAVGGPSAGNFNYGIEVSNSSITASGANVQVEGQGGGTGAASTQNTGVRVEAGGQVSAIGAGTVVVNGTGGGLAGASGSGVVVTSGSVSAASDVTVTGAPGGAALGVDLQGGTVSTTTGALVIAADSLNISGSASVSAGSGMATVRPKTTSIAINLGAATDPAAGPLSLTDAELDRITAGTLRIGSATSGAIAVSAAIGTQSTSRLHLITGGGVSAGAGVGITEGELAINAGGSIDLGFATANDVDVLAATTTTGAIQFRDTDALEIGLVSGITGLTTSSGTIQLYAGGALTVNQPIDTDSGGFSLNVMVSDALLHINATVSGTGSSAFSADKIDIDAAVTSGSSQIVLVPESTGDTDDAVNLGSTTDSAANTLELSDAELDLITASAIDIGSGSDDVVGPITISAAISRSSGHLVVFNAGPGSTITFEPGGSLSAPTSVNVSSGRGIFTDSTGVDITTGFASISGNTQGIGSASNPLRLAATMLTTGSATDAYLHEADSVTFGSGSSAVNANTATVHLVSGVFNLGISNSVTDLTTIQVHSGATLGISTLTETIAQLILAGGSVTGTTGVLTSTAAIDARSGSASALLGQREFPRQIDRGHRHPQSQQQRPGRVRGASGHAPRHGRRRFRRRGECRRDGRHRFRERQLCLADAFAIDGRPT